MTDTVFCVLAGFHCSFSSSPFTSPLRNPAPEAPSPDRYLTVAAVFLPRSSPCATPPPAARDRRSAKCDHLHRAHHNRLRRRSAQLLLPLARYRCTVLPLCFFDRV